MFFIIGSFLMPSLPKCLSLSSAVVSGCVSFLSWLSLFIFPPPWHSPPPPLNLFPSLGVCSQHFCESSRRREISHGIRGLWCNTIQSGFFLFFSRTFLRAEGRVLWALLRQERHYLLLCSSSRHSKFCKWGPAMLTLKKKNHLVSLLFHVLDINSMREALAVLVFRFIPSAAWKESHVLNRCLLMLVGVGGDHQI